MTIWLNAGIIFTLLAIVTILIKCNLFLMGLLVAYLAVYSGLWFATFAFAQFPVGIWL